MKRISIFILSFLISINLLQPQPVRATGGVGALNPLSDPLKKVQIILTLMLMAGVKGTSYVIEYAVKDTINKLSTVGKEVAYDLGTGAYKVTKDTIDFVNNQIQEYKVSSTPIVSTTPIQVTVEPYTKEQLITSGQTVTFPSPLIVKVGNYTYQDIIKVVRSSNGYQWSLQRSDNQWYSENIYGIGSSIIISTSQASLESYTSLPVSDVFSSSNVVTNPFTSKVIENDISISPSIPYTGGSIQSLTTADIGTLATVNDIPADTSVPGENTGSLDLSIPGDIALDFAPFQAIDLTKKFPFSIPWDILSSFKALNVSAVAPKFTLDFSMLTGGQKVDIDFKQFDKLASVVRWGTLIIFNIGLMIKTRQLIGG